MLPSHDGHYGKHQMTNSFKYKISAITGHKGMTQNLAESSKSSLSVHLSLFSHEDILKC